MSIRHARYSFKKKITMFIVGFIFSWAVLGSYKTFANGLWVQKDDGLDNGEWEVIRSGASGDQLVGIFNNYTDGLYYIEYSNNGGESWINITPNDPDVEDEDEFNSESADQHMWSDVDISEDGNVIVVSDNNGSNDHGYIWYSPNAGSIWSRANNDGQPGSGNWTHVTLGDDGQYLAATNGNSGNEIWVSTDYGNAWEHTEPEALKTWSDLSYSPNGDYLVAAESTSGYIWMSENQGTDWLPAGAPALTWHHLAVANDGAIIASADDYAIQFGKLVEENYVWTDASTGGTGETLVDISGDGAKLINIDWAGYIFTANTSDVTDWNSENITRQDWKALTINNDGSRMAVGGYLTEVWTAIGDLIVPTVESVSPANGATGVAINAPIIITFSEPMYNDLYLEIDFCGEDCYEVFDQVWSEDSTQVTLIKNDGPFANGTEYAAMLIAADVSGNMLDDPYEFSFTTVANGIPVIPTSTSRSGGHRASTRMIPLSTVQTPLPSEISPIKTISHDLELGMTSLEVTFLQEFLIAEAKGSAALALKNHGSTNFFGPLTRAALAEWQVANAIIPAAGYFGPKTRALIASLVLS